MPREDQTLAEFLEAVGKKSPTPGGGAVASVSAALSAALARMVVNYSLGKKSLSEHQEDLNRVFPKLLKLQHLTLDLAQVDANAYSQLNTLWKLEKTDPRRVENWDDAVASAIDAPHRLIECCLDLLEHLQNLTHRTNPKLASDLAIAAVLTDAAARAAGWNIRINLPLVSSDSARDEYEQTMLRDIERAGNLCQAVESNC